MPGWPTALARDVAYWGEEVTRSGLLGLGDDWKWPGGARR
jgi:hypothetical protein